MDAKDFARDLRKTVAELKSNGVSSMATDGLISYLDSFVRDTAAGETPSSAVDLELYKAKLQKWVEETKNTHAHSIELFKSVIQAGQSSLRTAFLMNGGAAVALLTFVGHLSITTPTKVAGLAPSLGIFVLGVLVAGVATGMTYLSQWFYAGENDWKEKTGFALNILAILTGAAAYVVFVIGTYYGYKVFSSYGQ